MSVNGYFLERDFQKAAPSGLISLSSPLSHFFLPIGFLAALSTSLMDMISSKLVVLMVSCQREHLRIFSISILVWNHLPAGGWFHFDMEIDMQPEPGNAIVKIPSSEYGDVPVNPTTFHSVTYGEIVALHDDDIGDYGDLIGRIGHWHKYVDDITLPGGFAVVELKDIKATTDKV